MTATPLPGMPEPAHADDYETWEAGVRPAFLAVAATGRPFLCWIVARDHRLPEPPDKKLDWARLMRRLHHDNVIQPDDFGLARDQSAVRRWRGTREAMQGRAA
jgi:hypothetical protein